MGRTRSYHTPFTKLLKRDSLYLVSFSYFINILHFSHLQPDGVPAELCLKIFLPAVKNNEQMRELNNV